LRWSCFSLPCESRPTKSVPCSEPSSLTHFLFITHVNSKYRASPARSRPSSSSLTARLPLRIRSSTLPPSRSTFTIASRSTARPVPSPPTTSSSPARRTGSPLPLPPTLASPSVSSSTSPSVTSRSSSSAITSASLPPTRTLTSSDTSASPAVMMRRPRNRLLC